jgi:hypothetical protein
MIKLNVLLPTYNYPLGLNLILNKILHEKKYINQVFIFDNTKNKSIYNLFQKFKLVLNINYHHNMPTTSPQINWQNLIKTSNCDYFIIMHHDDIPVEKNFFRKTHQLLNFYNKPDVLSVNTFINDSSILNNRIHTHASVRKIILKYFFPYIVLRNVIGPLSSLIIKKKKLINYTFDKRLNWLIDVKFYYHYLKKSSIVVTDLLSIKSLLLNKESLTLKIKNKFIHKYKEKKFITKDLLLLYYIFDFFFWYPYRVFSYTIFLIKKIFNSVIIKTKSLINSM